MGCVPSQFDDVEKDFLSRGHLAGTLLCMYTVIIPSLLRKLLSLVYWLLAGMFVN